MEQMAIEKPKAAIKTKLSEDELNNKILISAEKIRSKMRDLFKFTNDFQCYESTEFIQTLKSINFQYMCLNSFDVKLDDIRRLRKSNATVLISVKAVDVYYPLLNQIFNDIFGKNYSVEIATNIFLSVKYICGVFLNYSDASMEFGSEFVKNSKILNLYYKVIQEFKTDCLNNRLSKNLLEILRTTIATLYNTLLYDVIDNLIIIQEMNFLSLIKDFVSCDNERIKRSALLFTAYVANESESCFFKTEPKSISYLINLLKKSMASKYERAQGLSTEELSKGIEKLSKNDENKQLLVDMGILPVLKSLMEINSMKFKEIALSILWSLSFDERNNKIINNEFYSVILDMKNSLDNFNNLNTKSIDAGPQIPPGILEKQGFPNLIAGDTMNSRARYGDENEASLKVSYDSSGKFIGDPGGIEGCRKLVNGILWTLSGKQVKTRSKNLQKECHIMISYCRSNSETVFKIYDGLKEKGFKLWIDKYNITDSNNLMESMAQGVENSVAVIICVSLHYKMSDNCRAEALYAKTKKKRIIPIMVQKDYRPDGWLGITIAGLHYCDFLGRFSFDEALLTLIKQIESNQDKQEHVSLFDHFLLLILNKPMTMDRK